MANRLKWTPDSHLILTFVARYNGTLVQRSFRARSTWGWTWKEKQDQRSRTRNPWLHASAKIDGLVQERCNSIALAMELRPSCTNTSKWDVKKTYMGSLPGVVKCSVPWAHSPFGMQSGSPHCRYSWDFWMSAMWCWEELWSAPQDETQTQMSWVQRILKGT